jgi:hypothetical protein
MGDTVTVRHLCHMGAQCQLQPGDTIRVQDGSGTGKAQVLGRAAGLLRMF